MRRKLFKVAAIISMDPTIGDLRMGDILVEQDRIAVVAPKIAADDADVIDASHMLLLPGVINGHLHTWQTGLRGLPPIGRLPNTCRRCTAPRHPVPSRGHLHRQI
jgi:5-methylthioadenosine/S-adenosylhomocysteine deaminase